MAAVEHANRVEMEVEELKKDIVRLGAGNADGNYEVAFGVLFDDPKTEQFYEALVGTLKAAKKKGVINFKGQILMKGMHDKELITLLIPPDGAAPAPASPAPAAAAAESPAAASPAAAAAAEDLSGAVSGMSLGSGAAAEEPEGSPAGSREGSPARGPPSKRTSTMSRGFSSVAERDLDSQCEFFLKSFIFALGDDWKDVASLAARFKKCAASVDDDTPPEMLNHIQASGFLQKEGKTRTATQRKAELNDVDIDNDGFINFTEYLLLHYKPMILAEYYKRHETEPEEDLSNDCIGLVGVGNKLVEELLTLPKGLNPAIEAALEEFTENKKAREAKIKALEEKAAAGGVKGMAAKQELVILESGKDDTEMNRIEITLNAAKRKAAKHRGSVVLAQNRKAEEDAAEKLKAEKKAKMAAKMAMFGGGK